jgi:hypothetical protein
VLKVPFPSAIGLPLFDLSPCLAMKRSLSGSPLMVTPPALRLP